jgi:hypothetical protein
VHDVALVEDLGLTVAEEPCAQALDLVDGIDGGQINLEPFGGRY